MTTIVKHRRTGNEYILLGINGEGSKVNPSRFISELFNQEKSEVSYSATVCDVQGNIFLADIDDLVVTKIDGIKPSEILPESTYQEVYDDVEQSPPPELDDEEFESEVDQPLEPENTSKDSSVSPQVSVVNSLDAPNPDIVDDEDEEWI